jgi:hypothetical protein
MGIPAWAELAEVARQVGFDRLVAPIAALADSLLTRADTLRWDATPAWAHAGELCLLSRLASEYDMPFRSRVHFLGSGRSS